MFGTSTLRTRRPLFFLTRRRSLSSSQPVVNQPLSLSPRCCSWGNRAAMQQKKFAVGDLQISSVTVFKDRAEVTRTFETKLDAGQNKIVIEEFPATVREETISIDGHGSAVIQEVQYKSKQLKEDEYPEKLSKLNDELSKLRKEQLELNDRKNALARRGEALDRMATQNPPKLKEQEDGKEVPVGVPYDAEALEKVSKFFDLYEEKWTDLGSRVHSIDEQIEKLKKKERELQEIPDEQRNISRFVTVVLDCTESCNANLEIRYQVSQATWFPSYDIRVKTETGGEEMLKVIYQGSIRQTTGEDWIDTKLILSTADPSNVAQLRQLQTMNVAFREERRKVVNQVNELGPPMRLPSLFGSGVTASNVVWGSQNTGGLFGSAPPPGVPPVRFGLQEAHLADEGEEKRSFAAIFEIDRQASVPSDSGDHKVTITTLEVKPNIVHKTIPRHSSNVYITALAVNESQFPFLEGTAAIHFNNSFVAHSHLGRVDPGEKFSCNLGVDPSVIIDYKPSHETFSEVGPIVKIARMSHERTIVVHNKKQKTKVLLLLQENLPRSTEERIQVLLSSPKLAEPNKPGEMTPGARLNAANNLEWTLSLEPGEKVDVSVSYNIDHPVNEDIRFFSSSS